MSSAIDSLYAALEDGSRWPGAVAVLADLLELDVLIMVGLDDTGLPPIFLESGMSLARRRAYQAGGWRDDPWRAAIVAPPQGRWSISDGERLRVDARCADGPWLAHVMDAPSGARVRALAVSPPGELCPPFVLIAVQAAERVPMDDAVELVMQELGRHLARIEALAFAQVSALVTPPGDENAAFYALDANGGVVGSNAAGAALVEDGTFGLARGTLKPASTDAASWLYSRLTMLRAGQLTLNESHASMPMCNGRSGRLSLIASPRLALSPGLQHARAVLGVVPTPAPLVARRSQRDRTLTLMFGWTPTEADIAIRLSEGASVAGIAQARSCTVETVRSHLKSAKRKSAVSRQVDLVRLVLMSDDDLAARMPT